MAVFLRSPHAHAEIAAIEKAEALASPGVAATFTAEDVTADKLNGVSCAWGIAGKDGMPMKEPPHPLLAQGKVVEHKRILRREADNDRLEETIGKGHLSQHVEGKIGHSIFVPSTKPSPPVQNHAGSAGSPVPCGSSGRGVSTAWNDPSPFRPNEASQRLAACRTSVSGRLLSSLSSLLPY
jgi:hypothetical protein